MLAQRWKFETGRALRLSSNPDGGKHFAARNGKIASCELSRGTGV
jgi:hypothetical protein